MKIICPTILVLVFANFSVDARLTINNDKSDIQENSIVKAQGLVVQSIAHENLNCIFIKASKVDKNAEIIVGSHIKGGDIMACQDQKNLSKGVKFSSLKNTHVAIEGTFMAMNHSRINSNAESYPIVRIDKLQYLKTKRPPELPYFTAPVIYSNSLNSSRVR